jgi:hypothetical protein
MHNINNRETLDSFDCILQAATLLLWEVEPKWSQTELPNTTAATAPAVTQPLENIDSTNTTHQATQLQLLTLKNNSYNKSKYLMRYYTNSNYKSLRRKPFWVDGLSKKSLCQHQKQHCGSYNDPESKSR